MTISSKAYAIGLTGPFGSGCSTSGGILEDRLNYKHVRLSEVIKNRWNEKNPGQKATRADLQELGNRIRGESDDSGVLAKKTIELLEVDQNEYKYIVFDGIRNTGEIDALRERFGVRFYLFAFECPTSDRWERLGPGYDSEEDFIADDERDKDQEYQFGQQVQLCVDAADVLIDNSDEITLAKLRKKLVDYVNLVTGQKKRYAEQKELHMNLAYSHALRSKCTKRRVGAVLISSPPGEKGDIVGQGFNENPKGTMPCIEEPKYGAQSNVQGTCYRDIVRSIYFSDLMKRKAHCPDCGKKLEGLNVEKPPWRCNCGISLEKYFFQDRAMSWCTAIHAEADAITQAGDKSMGTTLYTTTFPCFQCAEKIIHAGIKNVVYTEPYPDIRANSRLKIGGVGTVRFEGVRSSRFDEIFAKQP